MGLNGEGAPLTGKLVDDSGDRLTPTHTQKGSRRYPYYVSHRLVTGTADPTAWRVPAAMLESGIAAAIAAHLRHMVAEHRLLAEPDIAAHFVIEAKLDDLLGITDTVPAGDVLALLEHGCLEREQVRLTLSSTAMAVALGVSPEAIAGEASVLDCPLSLQRRGTGNCIVTRDARRLGCPARPRRHPARLTCGGSACRDVVTAFAVLPCGFPVQVDLIPCSAVICSLFQNVGNFQRKPLVG